jgi:hypothetical protein
MNTFPVVDADGNQTSAFEIENVYISHSAIVGLLSGIEGVADVKARRPLIGSPEICVEFTYVGHEFVVWEPFGDSSRYWIGPRDKAEAGIDVQAIEDAFRRYRPPLMRRLVGDVLTLKIFGFKG